MIWQGKQVLTSRLPDKAAVFIIKVFVSLLKYFAKSLAGLYLWERFFQAQVYFFAQ